MRALGLTKIEPDDMLFVGDSVGELEPAKKLRIRSIGVLTGISSREERKTPRFSRFKTSLSLSKFRVD